MTISTLIFMELQGSIQSMSSGISRSFLQTYRNMQYTTYNISISVNIWGQGMLERFFTKNDIDWRGGG